MATRLYLPSSGAAAIAPAFDAAWERSDNAVKFAAVTTKIGSTMTTSGGIFCQFNSTTYDVAAGQYVYGPIGAQTITGNVVGQIRFTENTASLDASAQMVIRVIAPDATTVRGTLLAASAAGLSSEFATSLTNRTFPLGGSTAMSSVVSSDGDYIVIEFGYRKREANNFLRNCQFSYGDDNGTDLPSDQTTTTANNPWIEFSNTIALPSSGQPTSKRFGGVPFMGSHGSGLQAPVRQWIRRTSGLLTPQRQLWRPAHGID